MARRPLTSRPVDLIYFTFFLTHIPASILVDFQAIYPPALVPSAIQKLVPLYLSMTNDPLIGGGFGTHHAYAWFRSFLWLEFLFQLPVFVLGARSLWKDDSRIYLLLLIYGASTATTVLPCVATFLAVPTASGSTQIDALTDGQRLALLSGYVPFLMVPLVMTLDMAWRVWSMLDIKNHVRADVAARSKRAE